MTATIFTDYLNALGVPHTAGYSDRAFRAMPFKSLFGFSRLMQSYGVPSEAWQVTDKAQLTTIPPPFLAREGGRFVIVRSFGRDAAGATTVNFCCYGRNITLPLERFTEQWDGTVLPSYPDASSREPDFARHRFNEIMTGVKRWVLIICTALLIVWGVVTAGLYRNISTVCLTLVNLAGIAVTWLLILKSQKVHSASADHICGIIEQHGCDTVLEQKASSFYGIFSWSEVGITYFGVSTAILLLFPGEIHTLALINGCCLPFTLWSILYQKFRIHTWCTLCVTTQILLWLQFFCFLFGGWWSTGIWPLRLSLIPITATYAAVLMAVNRVMTFIKERTASSQ